MKNYYTINTWLIFLMLILPNTCFAQNENNTGNDKSIKIKEHTKNHPTVTNYTDTVNPETDETGFRKTGEKQAEVNPQSGISEELILGVPKVSDKSLFLLTDALKNIKGTQYVMFCPEHRLILLKYNPAVHSTPESVIRAIKDQNFPFDIYFKTNRSHADVMELCKNKQP